MFHKVDKDGACLFDSSEMTSTVWCLLIVFLLFKKDLLKKDIIQVDLTIGSRPKPGQSSCIVILPPKNLNDDVSWYFSKRVNCFRSMTLKLATIKSIEWELESMMRERCGNWPGRRVFLSKGVRRWIRRNRTFARARWFPTWSTSCRPNWSCSWWRPPSG